MIACYLLFLISILSAGALILILLRFRVYDFITWLGLTLSLGIGGYLFVIFLLYLNGIKVTRIALVLFMFLLLITLIVISLSKKDVVKKQYIDRKDTIFLLLALIFGLFIFEESVALPLYKADSVSVWGYKSKIVYYSRSIYSDDFFDIYRIHPHPNYPLFFPLLESSYYILCGKIDDRNVKGMMVFVYLAIVFLMYGFLKKHTKNYLFFSILFLSTPFFFSFKEGSPSSAYPDIIFSMFLTGSALFLTESFDLKNTVLAAIFLSFAVLTKREGIGLLVAEVLFLVIIFIFNRRKEIFYSLIRIVVYVSILISPWLFLRHYYSNFWNENYLNRLSPITIWNNWDRGVYVLYELFREMLKINNWGFIGALFFIGIVFYRKKMDVYRLLMLLCIIIAYIIAYEIAPWYGMEGLKALLNSSLDRIFLHIYPFLFFITAIMWNRKETKEEG